MAWGGFTPASPLLTVKSDGPEAPAASLCERLAAKGYSTVGVAAPAAVSQPLSAPVETETPAAAPADPADPSLPVSLDNTLKEMQAFAAEHPELGPIAGRSKATFLENLTAAWQKQNAAAESDGAAPEAPVEEELPVSMGNTLKEMQAFAAEHPELGEIAGKTKAAFFASLSEAWSKSTTAAAEPVA